MLTIWILFFCTFSQTEVGRERIKTKTIFTTFMKYSVIINQISYSLFFGFLPLLHINKTLFIKQILSSLKELTHSHSAFSSHTLTNWWFVCSNCVAFSLCCIFNLFICSNIVALSSIHPFFPHLFNPESQKPSCDTPWMSHQSVTGLIHKGRHLFTPTGNLESTVNLTPCMSLDHQKKPEYPERAFKLHAD